MNTVVKAHRIARPLAFAVVVPWALMGVPVPSASADPCPNAEVVFARGTDEPDGVGGFGQEFIDSLRSKAGGKSIGVYPVNYPATRDFPTALEGITDAGNHIQQVAAGCPNTKMVLGGYSQGAAVMGFVTSNAIPDGAPEGVPNPMSPAVADHVAAVVLLAKPSTQFMDFIGEPPITIGPLYAGKTIELCIVDDPVCADGADWSNWAAHNAYSDEGMIDRGASFAASRI